jgi:hypothetical protein
VLGKRKVLAVALGAIALGAAAVGVFVTLDQHTELYFEGEYLDCGSLLDPDDVYYQLAVPLAEDGQQLEGTAYGDGLTCDEQLEAAREVRQVAVIVALITAGLAVVVLTLPTRDPGEPTADDPVPVEG